MKRSLLVAAALTTLLLTGGFAEPPPQNWDGLVQVPSKRLKLVYLQPGADFRTYRSVMLDPTEVAFHKDWRRNYHFSVRDPSGRVSERDIERAISEGVTQASDIFAKAWQKGGYTLASAPGPDVLRVKTAILNINVSAPDVRASPSRSAADTAGDAVLVVEVRDSMSNALLGRAVDHRISGDNTIGWRSSATNRGDFRDLVENWAKISVQGLSELRNSPPVAR